MIALIDDRHKSNKFIYKTKKTPNISNSDVLTQNIRKLNNIKISRKMPILLGYPFLFKKCVH